MRSNSRARPQEFGTRAACSTTINSGLATHQSQGAVTRSLNDTTGDSSTLGWNSFQNLFCRDLIAGLIQEIDAEAAAERKRTGREPLGAATVLRQHPHTCPNKTKKSPAPRFHAASKTAREAFRTAYGFFLAAFREAAERLKAGDRLARFPNGCFPPGLPFVHV